MNRPVNDCPVPENESQRLRALRSYEILDSQPEVDFDTLTRVATHALGTPAGVIGLMDANRLWFKSRIGLGVPQLDRQIAFCAHAIMQPGEPLIVEDLQQDPRFKGNPLVTQAPHLRFYAGAPLIDRNGFALGTIAVVDIEPRKFGDSQVQLLRDLSVLVITALESRHRAKLLSQLAMTDHLTGLPNRAQFERTLNSEIAHARRMSEPFTVLFMDLDGFKVINDTFGHHAGDEVLCEVARRIEKLVRAEDLLARFGGDEFGIFMRQSDDNTSQSLANRIVDALLTPIALSTGQKVTIGISIGIASYAGDIDTVETLLDLADQALYKTKRNSSTCRRSEYSSQV
ncbi:response regulator PleD [mine drainage metagenome]|uniref:Response regulator PleD n=1 Tax=mine drainage metagenome TaxID=410659 RepID=A0A1J5TBH6_9ZZZZ